MSDVVEPGGPWEIPEDPSPPMSSSDEGLSIPPSTEPRRPEMDTIDREVAEALGSMDAQDLAELCGETVPSDACAAGETIEPGTKLIGTVVGMSEDEVYLEFGPKSQGMVPKSQFGKKEVITHGRRVDVIVERYDMDADLLVVNREGAPMRATWTNLAVGAIVEGRVTGMNKGGLELDLKGIRAFMPASQADVTPMKDISVFLNTTLRCEVIELDRRDRNVLLSRRKILERDAAEARKKLKAELVEGQTRTGIVGTIMDYGAFIDLGGIDGLAHIRDLSWGTVDKVADVLTPGEEVEVMILRIDHERDRISLGVKQCQPDPWASSTEKYPDGTALKVRIVRLAGFGAFAELETGVDGLIPISEMSWSRVNQPSDLLTVGDIVDVVVIRFEPEKRRIALSMKQAQTDPWAGVLETFSEQSLVQGRVTRLTDFGVFVELVPGVEGLIHISELADRRVKSCAEVVQEGQEVEARVLGVDRENRRISLSIRAVTAPLEAAAEVRTDEPPKKSKKRKKPLRGGLASHFDW